MPNQSRKLKHINLIKHRQRRNILGRKMEKTWFIGKGKNGTTYFICEHDSEENTTMWCTTRKDALSFKTERAVHRFLKRFMPNRTDIMLVSVEN